MRATTSTPAAARLLTHTATLYEQRTGTPLYERRLAALLLDAATANADADADLAGTPMPSDTEICRRVALALASVYHGDVRG